ncbi:hypothetical protein [Agaribacter marinus]|uniref:Uncharacterized protein n=1 Tax=Agaribacter marinus TaxID=1431249 RepID=A0AA37T5B6_9ALTE|nr:hypothetical protein [Agaribacter marinus]GLR71785.1 hypothetical protein GCM10007852_26930 [Agaribacter marinus]
MNNSEKDMTQQLEALPREKTPSRDLWPGIEYAISQRQAAEKTSWRRQTGIAASFLVALLVGYMGYQGLGSQGILQNNQAIAEQMSVQFMQQRDALLISLDGQNATTQNWQQQLDELDAAAKAIKTALKEDPNNQALLAMLKNVYEQQLKLIERVHAPSWQQI